MKKIARLLVMALAAGSIFTVTAQPASAAPAACPTVGQVYVSPAPNLYVVRRETDPINGTMTTIRVNVPDTGGPYAFTVKVGGTGLAENSTPWWDVVDTDGYIHRVTGNAANTNCVSVEKTHAFSGVAGDTFRAKTNYDAGNSGAKIRNQNHFVLVFY
jgi:hypothetical protein